MFRPILKLMVFLFSVNQVLSSCFREYNSENYEIYSGKLSVGNEYLPYLLHYSNSHNEFLVYLSGDPLQGNMIDYFSFINPDLLNKNSDEYVVRHSVYLNSPLENDYIINKKDFIDEKTFNKINQNDKFQDLKFVNFGSEQDYLERYNFLFIDGLLGGGFKNQGSQGV